MKNKTNQKFVTVLLGALGTIVSTLIVFMMIMGRLQEKIQFSGIFEELAFSFFAVVIGLISLIGTVSAVVKKD
jgi:uncharacterized membrane protein